MILKPGMRSTELYLTIFYAVVGVAVLIFKDALFGTALLIANCVTYAFARAWIKASAMSRGVGEPPRQPKVK